MSKRPLFLRIDEGLDRQLTEICEKEGYKKTGLIQKLIRDFVGRNIEGTDPIQEAKDFGIDLTLLRSNLRKSPLERLRDHESAQHFAQKLRQAVQNR